MRTSFKKKSVLFILGIILFSVCGSFILLRFYNEDRHFEQQAAVIFQDEMTSNTLSMHYTLAHPENFGISEYEPVLPCYSLSGRQTAPEALKQYLAALSRLSPQDLNDNNRYTYTLLVNYLEHALSGTKYLYYDDPLSPSSGMQSQLPILLAEYTFRSRRDVEDYLAILDQTDEYFGSLAVYEQEKCNAGLASADSTLKQVIKQCSSILSEKELAEGTHFLQTTFSERLEPLVQSGTLTQTEAALYISENNKLLTTVMQPAYEKLADDLFLLAGDGTSAPHGLAAWPLGKEYYTHLVRQVTGSSRSVDEIKELLYPQFESEYHTLRNLMTSRENAAEIRQSALGSSQFPYAKADLMITDLQSRMQADFPAFPVSSSNALPYLTLKSVNKSLANYCAPAFYLTPPLDDTGSNVIYINPRSTSAGLELYTTLAHEGYPGHLYQSVYSQLFMQTQNTHPVRQLLWYGGYLEGWALYVEFLSYDYAIALAQENGLPDAAYAYETEKHNRSMQLCLYSLLDLSIHYDNASYEQIHQVLCSFGITNPAVTRNIYDYICEEPACYLKYYLGYMEILSLKEKARALWKEDYSDLRFHQFFLECGPSDFDTLESALS